MRTATWLVLLLSSVALAGCFSTPPEAEQTVIELGDAEDSYGEDGATRIRLQAFATGYTRPIGLASAPGESDGIYVIEQAGRVWRQSTEDGASRALFTDIRDEVSSGGERGLFAVAFHPDFTDNGRYFVHYTDTGGDTDVAERSVDDTSMHRVLLELDQPYSNHNGGGLAFGPDGFLYLALGDGGGAGDPAGNAQDLGSLLGKILRVDVDVDDVEDADVAAYGIPRDNPFVDVDGARNEIWAYGLRNPWRFSFDDETGDLWIADVGQNKWEEVNRQPGDSAGGENYGWNIWEASERFRPGSADGDVVFPVAAYSLTGGRCAIQGGFVVRSDEIPVWRDAYIYADYCSRTVFALHDWEDAATANVVEVLLAPGTPTAFGLDAEGRLYLATHDGTVYRFAYKAS